MDYVASDGGVLLPKQGILAGGKFIGTIIRDGKIIDEFEDHNLVVNEGLNALLDIMFHGSTQITQWYLGVFEANYTPVSTVTAATITAASTECTAYASATRPTYDEAAAASQVTTNSASRASFVFNATKTIYGGFLVSSSTKSGTSGTLFAAAQFSSSKAVVSGDELLLTYQFTASSV
jgi:hypothetical protein